MEMRPLGETGVRLSVIGFGGIVAAGKTQAEAQLLVNEAIEAGINYFDFAPTYGDCEERLGPALRGERDRLFLACKTTQRTRKESQEELERSLRRLRTDHFDLYQLYGVGTVDEVKTIFSDGGAIHTLIAAKQKGQTRFLGFSAHSEDAALVLMQHFAFDTVLFPINWVCWSRSGFGSRVVDAAQERRMGVLALKAMARQKWPENARREDHPACWYQPEDRPDVASLGFRFAWSRGATACVPPGNVALWKLSLQLAAHTSPLSRDEESRLAGMAKEFAPIFPQ